jgi:hypothetical protein
MPLVSLLAWLLVCGELRAIDDRRRNVFNV